MSDDDLESVFKRAAQLAGVVPENMRAAAFDRALDLLMSQPTGKSKTDPRRKSRRTANARPNATSEKTPVTPVSRAARATKGRPGPKAMLEGLIDEGFFEAPKNISDIIGHERKRQGHLYKATDLSPSLVRLLRDRRLEREKNDDGVYEYHSN